MRRRNAIGAIILLLIAMGCGVGAWQALQPDTARFVVPGATHVQVQQRTPGIRVVSFDFVDPRASWDTLLDQRLRAARWLPPDFSGAPGQFTIYGYVNSYWFGSIWEEANLQGNAQHATVILRRWLRLRWPPGYSIGF